LLFELDIFENVNILRYINHLGVVTNVRFNKFNGHSLQGQNYDKKYANPEFTNLLPILNNHYILFELGNLIFNASPFIHFSFEGPHLKLCYFKKIVRDNENFLFEQIGGTDRDIVIPAANLDGCLNNTLHRLL
jgi:hypothetical protein